MPFAIICYKAQITLLNLTDWLLFSPALFLLSLCIILWNWQNFIITLLGIELMYFSITSGFIFTGWALNEAKGHIYALLLVVLAASESAVGLGILVVLYRFSKSIEFADYDEIQG
jgi:NADH-quinone oxidoreductase subunit K